MKTLIKRLIPHSIAMQMQAYSEAQEVEHVEVFPNDTPPVPHSKQHHQLKGTWIMHEFWRKEKNKVQRELEAGK